MIFIKEALNKSFDRLRACPGLDPGTNGKLLIPFVVMLSAVEASNHERNPLIQRFLSRMYGSARSVSGKRTSISV